MRVGGPMLERKRLLKGRTDERDDRYWADDATAGTGGSRSKNHESEESTNCCVETFRHGRQVKVLNLSIK
jgi:hypothetical protein